MSRIRAGIPTHSLDKTFMNPKVPHSKFEPMLNATEIWELAGVHRTTVAHWVTDGLFPKPHMYTGRYGKAYWLKSAAVLALQKIKQGETK